MFHLKLDNESGMVLLVALVVTLLSAILAGSFMSITIYESRHSVWQKQRAQSLLLAEAAVQKSLYYLNNRDDPDNPWVDEDRQMLATPLEYTGSLAGGNYEVSLYSPADKPWLPADSYLIETMGSIPKSNIADIERRVMCIAGKLEGLSIPAALSIFDDADPEIELDNFNSSQWTIDGTDMDDPFGSGVMGLAVANTGDNLPVQLGVRIDQVTGADEWGNSYTGAAAILEDPLLPKNLDAYAAFFSDFAIDISGSGNIPDDLLGGPDDFQILYADLSAGDLQLTGNMAGYGVLVLAGSGAFKLAGRAEWNGIIICASDSMVQLRGGGSTPSHIYGALLLANGTAEMNGTADIVYSSDNVAKVNASLLLYRIYSWCGGWGSPLGSDDYYPICSEESIPDGTY